MKYHPIQLGIPRQDWSGKAKPRHFSNQIDTEKTKILERDNHTCQFCGFRAEKYQEIHHKNGEENDFSDDNCLTACIFCHQCFDLISVTDMNSGVLIWLPEIGQAALHHIMRALYIARFAQGPLSEASKSMLNILKERRLEAKKRLGSDNPSDLAVVLDDFLNARQYKRVQSKLKGIRLMPLDRRIVQDGDLKFNKFPQILAHWRLKGGPFTEISPEKWGLMFKELDKAS